ncbi:MAG: DPP IV N-terminal domain-containing protein [Muribaculaceae bacterium]|nr:DPP IV N-terminal domain-containing protein [Muribaculaceae bacterium]
MNKLKMIMAGVMALGALSASALDVNDYCDLKKAAPKSVKEITPMPDSETYAAADEDGKVIALYSFKTGEKAGELFNADAVKGDVKIEAFDGFCVSANGQKVLLWTDSEKIYRNSFTAEYYVYDRMRQTMKRVSTQGPQRGAVISHDGRLVAYMRGNNVFISNLDYETDRAITTDGKLNAIINGAPDWSYEEEFGMTTAMRWNGDDTILAFLQFDESGVPEYSFMDYKSYCQPDPVKDPYPQDYTYKYGLAGYPVSKVTLIAYDLDTRSSKTMQIPIEAEDYIPTFDFDGKGENMMVVTLNHAQNHMRLFRVNPRSTVARLLVEEKSEAWIAPENFGLNRYYDNFFVYGSDKSGYRHLYKSNYEGGSQSALTSGDFNVTANYGYDAAKGTHYVQTTKLGAVNRNVAAVKSNGALDLLNNQPGWEEAMWSSNMKYWLREWSDVTTPPVYTLVGADGKGGKTVEDNAAYKAKYAAAPRMELLKVRNDAGQEMDAYMIKPEGFSAGTKYPVLMYQYNGPDSQEVRNKWRVDGLNYLASQGYLVCCVDGRGTGFRARSWAYAVYKNLGDLETSDQIAGARYFASLPYADSSRVGCFGWSYGGYMTLMELQRAGNPFKCGVSMAPVADWRFYDNIYTERYMLTPRQNERGYTTSSPLEGSANMNAPLLIMSGTNDDNVHFYNTLEYTAKLNSEGKIFDMMAYAGFDHSLRKCNARVQLYRKIADFLKLHL